MENMSNDKKLDIKLLQKKFNKIKEEVLKDELIKKRMKGK